LHSRAWLLIKHPPALDSHLLQTVLKLKRANFEAEKPETALRVSVILSNSFSSAEIEK